MHLYFSLDFLTILFVSWQKYVHNIVHTRVGSWFWYLIFLLFAINEFNCFILFLLLETWDESIFCETGSCRVSVLKINPFLNSKLVTFKSFFTFWIDLPIWKHIFALPHFLYQIFHIINYKYYHKLLFHNMIRYLFGQNLFKFVDNSNFVLNYMHNNLGIVWLFSVWGSKISVIMITCVQHLFCVCFVVMCCCVSKSKHSSPKENIQTAEKLSHETCNIYSKHVF